LHVVQLRYSFFFVLYEGVEALLILFLIMIAFLVIKFCHNFPQDCHNFAKKNFKFYDIIIRGFFYGIINRRTSDIKNEKYFYWTYMIKNDIIII